jgi:hypothetical protein
MSARDELARAIFLADNSGAPPGLMEAEWDQGMHGPDSYAHNIADGLLAAGYRKVVTKPAEIPVLPGQITVDTVLGA